jgi:hypothetical protein
LAPIRNDFSPQVYDPLVAGLTLLFGIDPIVSLRDNGDVATEEIPNALAWIAYQLVDAALANPGKR